MTDIISLHSQGDIIYPKTSVEAIIWESKLKSLASVLNDLLSLIDTLKQQLKVQKSVPFKITLYRYTKSPSLEELGATEYLTFDNWKSSIQEAFELSGKDSTLTLWQVDITVTYNDGKYYLYPGLSQFKFNPLKTYLIDSSKYDSIKNMLENTTSEISAMKTNVSLLSDLVSTKLSRNDLSSNIDSYIRTAASLEDSISNPLMTVINTRATILYVDEAIDGITLNSASILDSATNAVNLKFQTSFNTEFDVRLASKTHLKDLLDNPESFILEKLPSDVKSFNTDPSDFIKNRLPDSMKEFVDDPDDFVTSKVLQGKTPDQFVSEKFSLGDYLTLEDFVNQKARIIAADLKLSLVGNTNDTVQEIVSRTSTSVSKEKVLEAFTQDGGTFEFFIKDTIGLDRTLDITQASRSAVGLVKDTDTVETIALDIATSTTNSLLPNENQIRQIVFGSGNFGLTGVTYTLNEPLNPRTASSSLTVYLTSDEIAGITQDP